ncbi:MAG: hypothetical protein HY302_14995 [Opitutae bacterium]|nr:hypothetical protein [Opitutae bacterium]
MRKLLFLFVPGIVMFALGGLWNAVLLAKLSTGQAPVVARLPEDVRLGVIVLAYALLTAFMTFLFTQSFREKPGSIAGFQFGSLFGAVVWNVSLGTLLVDSLWHGFEQGIGGLLMAALHVPKVTARRSNPPS